MKNTFKPIVATFIVLMLITQGLFANTTITLNGRTLPLKYQVQAERIANTAMVPLRDVFEAVGAKVSYDAMTRTAISEKDKTIIRIQLGARSFSVNGKVLQMSEPAQLRNGRMLIPAHVVGQAFGLDVALNTNTLSLNTLEEKPSFRIATLSGPTGVAMAQLISNSYLGENAQMTYEVLSNPQLLPAKLIKGEVDMAFLPTNMASIIYNQSKGQVVALSANIWGLLSVISTDPTITRWDQLKGKQIDIFGQGATPEFAFKALAEANGLDASKDLSYKFSYDAASSLATALIGNQVKDGLAVLPEPATTMVLQKNPNARVILGFGPEWTKAFGGNGMPMSVIVVRKAFLEENKHLVATFLREFKHDIAIMNANPKHVSNLVSKLPELNVAASAVEAAIPRSGYRFETATSSKAAIEKYLGVLMHYDAKSIGGKLPGADFYVDVLSDY